MTAGHLSSGHGAGSGGGHRCHVVARLTRVSVRGQARDVLAALSLLQPDLARVAASLRHVPQWPCTPVGHNEVPVIIIIIIIVIVVIRISRHRHASSSSGVVSCHCKV